MKSVTFEAQEYNSDGLFQKVTYQFEGSEDSGWTIRRSEDGFAFSEYLSLSDGYCLVKVAYCGVCTTDISRHHLPFPLPQITGHEVVGYIVSENDTKIQRVAVEINASHYARGLSTKCQYCTHVEDSEHGMNRQCPERLTIGIDRLPGGFAQYLLAPRKSIIPVPDVLSDKSASLAEPFAAALHAVESTYIKDNTTVGVLGPRKLGMLIIAALAGVRKQRMQNQSASPFKIIAFARHENLKEKCLNLGADDFVNIEESQKIQEFQHAVDIVFDTTGTSSGFETALKLTKEVLHLKSTSGSEIFNIKHFTEMVVEEQCLLPFSAKNFFFTLPKEIHKRFPKSVYLSPSLNQQSTEIIKQDIDNFLKQNASSFENYSINDIHYSQISVKEALEAVQKQDEHYLDGSYYPRFDIAIVSTVDEVDTIIRPLESIPPSILRARGAILLFSQSKTASGPVEEALNRGVAVITTRCGDIKRALDLLAGNVDIAQQLEKEMISNEYELDDINEAFKTARDSKTCMKALIRIATVK